MTVTIDRYIVLIDSAREETTEELRLTQVFRRKADGWKLVHRRGGSAGEKECPLSLIRLFPMTCRSEQSDGPSFPPIRHVPEHPFVAAGRDEPLPHGSALALRQSGADSICGLQYAA